MSSFIRIRLHGEFVLVNGDGTFGFFTTIHLPDMSVVDAKRRVHGILLSRMKDDNISTKKDGFYRSVLRVDAMTRGYLKGDEAIPSDGGFNFYPMSAKALTPALRAWWRRRTADKCLLDDVLE